MIVMEGLYVMDVVVFRKELCWVRNAAWTELTEDRARKDARIIVQGGIERIVANGNDFPDSTTSQS
ncbi:hypothetical protein ACJJIL_11420 [Microbulbifer sp. EKSA005]|uniref:hypothetical protein n=1 Tax=Microbulbifer sp. EKSA005 TaxID=3243364 RepID=UPI004042C8D2